MLKLVWILSFGAVANAALARYRPEPKPEKYADQEGCYFSKYDIVLPYGVPFSSGDCGQYVCQKNNEVVLETCGAIAVRDGCRKSPEDLTKSYPDCCSKEVCDDTTSTAPTTQAPSTEAPVVTNAYAESDDGQPLITETDTSGPGASAYATAS